MIMTVLHLEALHQHILGFKSHKASPFKSRSGTNLCPISDVSVLAWDFSAICVNFYIYKTEASVLANLEEKAKTCISYSQQFTQIRGDKQEQGLFEASWLCNALSYRNIRSSIASFEGAYLWRRIWLLGGTYSEFCRYKVAFVMPSKYSSVSELPKPNNAAVQLKQIEGHTLAAISWR